MTTITRKSLKRFTSNLTGFYDIYKSTALDRRFFFPFKTISLINKKRVTFFGKNRTSKFDLSPFCQNNFFWGGIGIVTAERLSQNILHQLRVFLPFLIIFQTNFDEASIKLYTFEC